MFIFHIDDEGERCRFRAVQTSEAAAFADAVVRAAEARDGPAAAAAMTAFLARYPQRAESDRGVGGVGGAA
jgi:hypothetical protein